MNFEKEKEIDNIQEDGNKETEFFV